MPVVVALLVLALLLPIPTAASDEPIIEFGLSDLSVQKDLTGDGQPEWIYYTTVHPGGKWFGIFSIFTKDGYLMMDTIRLPSERNYLVRLLPRQWQFAEMRVDSQRSHPPGKVPYRVDLYAQEGTVGSFGIVGSVDLLLPAPDKQQVLRKLRIIWPKK